MMVTKKALPRRTVLRGLGTALALPLLDGMVPALTATVRSAAAFKPRLGVVYVPHGAVMDNWTPSTEGLGFEFTPILQPLEPFRDRLLVLSGLDHAPGAQMPGDPAGGHGRITGAFLTGVHAKPTEGADFEAGRSFDQIAAERLGEKTELGSLELGIGLPDFGGACDAGFSCAYISTLCWSSPTTPLPMESNPRAVFERLFGDGTDTNPAARLERFEKDRSVLDAVTEKVARLRQTLGAADRAKLGDYLAAVRDVERRIERAEDGLDREMPLVERPAAGVPPSFGEYVKVMFDLQVLAYQADLTRVISFLMTPELTAQTYPEIGVPDAHHALSHHENKPDSLAKLTKVGSFHTELFSYYLEKLRATQDGDGSLLDQVMIIYGSGMSNSNLHNIQRLPILLAGGGGGQIHGGRHVQYADGTPLTNLYMSLLNKLAIPVESIGDSTGQLRELTDI
ncbi:MAG: hypothetical protein CL484_13550 [Acidobacteria bacterium]|nr:hypothetical protein [Acidobacteriota bacterium]|tara:strand:+ start:15278 stop:16636 length:1359 start_codon:yes stop_codon:yes gene_type:complete